MSTPPDSFAPLRIAFLGTHHPAAPTLRTLAEMGWIAVVVMPIEAREKNDQLLKLCGDFSLPWTYELHDIDQHQPNLILAANYPKLVPARYLERLPCLNTHWSLLPRWRGVHPTAWALINGDEKIGLSVHLMARDFDVGPVLAQRSISMSPVLTLELLHQQLADLQAIAVLEVLERYRATGRFEGQIQDESQATYVPQRMPEDGLIDWSWPAARIAGLVKALPPPKYPGAFTHLGSRKLIIADACVVDCPVYFATVGQVVRVLATGEAWVKAGDKCLAVRTVALASDDLVLPARKLLKRGAKLGLDLTQEVLRLREEITRLQAQLAQLVARSEATV
jgi:methionyl-tRNA formyltransferase